MGYRVEKFVPGNIYHLYNRGVEKRSIFTDNHDRARLRTLLTYCLPRATIPSYSIYQRFKSKRLLVTPTASGKGLVDILCFCFMRNHVHLLVKENVEHGVSRYMQRLANSYARYFNVRHHRSGPLFSGPFKAVGIEGDEQFLHVTRYIHLNPYVAGIVTTPLAYAWSSLGEYLVSTTPRICHTELLASIMAPEEYKNFVSDHADYARELEDIKHLLIDGEP